MLVSVIFGGCATFKQLEPQPEVSSVERGYIELKDDKDNFELDKDGKYFIKFPAPPKDKFYLVLVTSSKPSLRSFLTSTFEDEKTPGPPITDEGSLSDSILVFAVDRSVPMFYWIIESASDQVLSIRYRYAPQWRYTFENTYAAYQKTLADNTVNRSTYNSMDARYDLDKLDLSGEIQRVDQRTAAISAMNEELLRLASIFPADIAASKDTAYEQYVAFKAQVDDELTFQKNFSTVLTLFKKEKDTRGNTALFLESAPYFTEIASQRDRFPAGVRAKIVHVLYARLAEVAPFLDGMIRTKTDISKISPAPSVAVVGGLYTACDRQMPRETEALLRFITRFNTEAEGLQSSNAKFEALNSQFNSGGEASTEAFYADLAAKATGLKASIPEPQASRIERYGSYPSATVLTREITVASNRADDLVAMYQSAASIAANIGGRMWGSAESGLRELHDQRGVSASPEITAQRSTLVNRFESGIYTAVKSASEQRIDAFIKAHEVAIDSVAILYADSAFLPVHQLTFSSLGSSELMRKRREIEGYLENIKFNQFPESSIKAIYAEFLRNSRERGVEKARAIVDHGKFYKGNDKQVKGLITECDVQAAKWIIRPKEYRKLFALPVTSNKNGENEYMFRIRLQIPSEAEFPVFDVNIKLPQDIAEKAGQTQWYESMTIDKKPLKNEGRFRITAPTAENNYETLITPLQMDKDGRNVLEVRFKYPGFRVFEVSLMAQVPIIRKN